MAKFIVTWSKRISKNYSNFYSKLRRLEKSGRIRRIPGGAITESKELAKWLFLEACKHFREVALSVE